MNHLHKNEGHSTEIPAHPARGQVRAGGKGRAIGRTRPAGHVRSSQAAAGDAHLRIPIRSHPDILEARSRARALAAEMQFPPIERTLIASAISELARNIVAYASHGEIRLERAETLGSRGIVITASDLGPGIRNVRGALQEGSSLQRNLGLGLPGIKRVMDEFEIVSRPRQGTTVTVKKWKPQ